VAAGPADRSDAEPLGRDGVDLAVAMARDDHFHAVPPAEKRRHQVLAMPEHRDPRRIGIEALVAVGRLDHEAVGLPHQPQIFSRQHTDGDLKPA